MVEPGPLETVCLDLMASRIGREIDLTFTVES